MITSFVSLNVDPAGGTLSAVSITCFYSGSFRPMMELFVSLLECFTGQSGVPGGVALKAPLEIASGAPQFDVLLFQPELPWQLVFGNRTTARARLLAAVVRGVDQESIVP